LFCDRIFARVTCLCMVTSDTKKGIEKTIMLSQVNKPEILS
jgi:hypothetical protein